jgi:hypothetical protein
MENVTTNEKYVPNDTENDMTREDACIVPSVTRSVIRYQDIRNMISCPDTTRRRMERNLHLAFSGMIFSVFFAAVCALAYFMFVTGGAYLHPYWSSDDYRRDCVFTALIDVTTLYIIICKPLMRMFIYPRLFPLMTLSKIGYCFKTEGLMRVLEAEDAVLQKPQEFFNKVTESGLEIFVNTGKSKYVYQIWRKNRRIPEDFYRIDSLDFSWLDACLLEFEDIYCASGITQRFLNLIRRGDNV